MTKPETTSAIKKQAIRDGVGHAVTPNPTAPAEPDPTVRKPRRPLSSILRDNVSYIAFAFLVIVFWILAGDRFMSWTNWRLILEQLPVLAILAIGMTFVITGGFIDLSVGSVVGISALCAAMGATSFGPIGLLLGIVVGAFVGLVNGVLFAKLKIPSFITTLASMVAVRALVAIVSGGFAVYLDQTNAANLGFLSELGRFPWVVIITAVIAVTAGIFYHHSVFGRDLRAVGGNEKIVDRSGISVTRIKITVFVLSGSLAGVAALISLAQFGAAGPQTGIGLELYAISAVVLGGTPLTGGQGSIAKSIVGAMALIVLADGLTIAGVPPSWNDVVRGALLVIAIAIALDRRKIGIVK